MEFRANVRVSVARVGGGPPAQAPVVYMCPYVRVCNFAVDLTYTDADMCTHTHAR